jgi:hypothetical protein
VLKLAGGGGGSGGILRAAIGVEFAGGCDSVIFLQINLRFVSYVELAASFGSKNRLLMRQVCNYQPSGAMVKDPLGAIAPQRVLLTW